MVEANKKEVVAEDEVADVDEVGIATTTTTTTVLEEGEAQQEVVKQRTQIRYMTNLKLNTLIVISLCTMLQNVEYPAIKFDKKVNYVEEKKEENATFCLNMKNGTHQLILMSTICLNLKSNILSLDPLLDKGYDSHMKDYSLFIRVEEGNLITILIQK